MLIPEMKLALGTTNQAKRAAVIKATSLQPICLSVPSGVSEQPLSEDETIRGAIHRAKHVLAAVPQAHVGLGLEGGLTYDDVYTHQWYLISVCAAWDGELLRLGKGLYFPIPYQVGEKVSKEGVELRHVIDELGNMVGNNHREGAYGFFTGGRITRANVFSEAVIAALMPFHSRLYSR